MHKFGKRINRFFRDDIIIIKKGSSLSKAKQLLNFLNYFKIDILNNPKVC